MTRQTVPQGIERIRHHATLTKNLVCLVASNWIFHKSKKNGRCRNWIMLKKIQRVMEKAIQRQEERSMCKGEGH